MPSEDRNLSNAEIANRLSSLAQLLSTQKENPYKIRAYRRAAAKIRTLSESIAELVRDNADLTVYAGIGEAISHAVKEIVHTGTLGKLEKLRSLSRPELVELSDYPRLDPNRMLRIYKKLGIGSIQELRSKLDSGELQQAVGFRMAQHVRQGITENYAMLLYHAHALRGSVEEFLLVSCGARRVEAVGDYRRRVDTIEELSFLIQADDFPALIARIQRYGGHLPLIESRKERAVFSHSSGILLRVELAERENWGLSLICCTGSKSHLQKLEPVIGGWKEAKRGGPFAAEADFYHRFGLSFIEPELREGYDEVDRATSGSLPVLVTNKDLCGDLHTHSRSSDGSDSIEAMAVAARDLGYQYIGITDHSQSLKIARGVSVAELWLQVRYIDQLNSRLQGIRVLKSAEVDILEDGRLDYSDDLLQELDYTVCSIHSRFGFDKQQQTERILRAMDNRHFNILGHATGRLLLKRPGYELDMERIVEHARKTGCFFEINSSPDRLDLSAEHARLAREAGVKIAVSSDAHSTREFGTLRYGIEQARRAGLDRACVVNCLPWESLAGLFHRG